MNPIAGLTDWFFGRGEYAVTVSPMDGALRPNSILDTLPVFAEAEDADNLAVAGGRVMFSSGRQLIEVADDGSLKPLSSFAAQITAIAMDHGGTAAVATADGALFVGLPQALERRDWLATKGYRCLTAMAFDGSNRLLVCNGSRENPAFHWSADLLERRRSGSVLALDLSNGSIAILADKLAFPSGLLCLGERVIVSEAWRHRLIELSAEGKVKPLLADLPGYPSRLASGRDGIIHLCVFAPRSQLVEFVLREPAYLKRMMRDVPKEFWIAPAYRSGASFLEPLQGGGVKQMGILKPWAPSRSYGLAIDLDENFEPVRSYHSRADGRRHGINSIALLDGSVLMASRGSGEILRFTGEARHARLPDGDIGHV